MSSFFKSLLNYDLFSSSASSQVNQDLQVALQPLEFKRYSHFNFSAVLFIEGSFDENCLKEEQFLNILQHNELEALLSQLLSVMFVAADRCKESISPKAQISLQNGIVLTQRMLSLYSSFLLERPKTPSSSSAGASNASLYDCIEPPHFSAEFYKQMVRMLLLTGDDKAFQSNVIFSSNKLFAYLLLNRMYSPLFMTYILDSRFKESSTVQAVFLSCFPRLLLYECDEQTRGSLMFAYSIMWSLCSYNNFNNPMIDMLAARNQETKLLNLIDLLMLHISRIETQNQLCVPALRFLTLMVLYNPNFRHLFIKSSKFEKIWKILFELAHQNLASFMTTLSISEQQSISFQSVYNKAMNIAATTASTFQEEESLVIYRTELIMSLINICWNNVTFQSRITNCVIDKHSKDFFDLSLNTSFSSGLGILSSSLSDVPQQYINHGKLYSFITWLNLMLDTNVYKKYDDLNILSLVKPSISNVALRILRNICDKHDIVLTKDLELVKGFRADLVINLIATLKATSDDSISNFESAEEAIQALKVFRENALNITHILTYLITKTMQIQQDANASQQPSATGEGAVLELHEILCQYSDVFQKTISGFEQCTLSAKKLLQETASNQRQGSVAANGSTISSSSSTVKRTSRFLTREVLEELQKEITGYKEQDDLLVENLTHLLKYVQAATE